MPSHPFELRGSGGLALRGDVDLPDDARGELPVIVAVHGFKGFRRWGFHPHFARAFAAAGFGYLRFDMTHNGVGPGGLEFDEEELFERNTWAREEEDLGVVLDALRAGGLPGVTAATRVGLLGHSRGGGLVVTRAATDPGVRATVALAPIATILRFSSDVLEQGLADGFIPIRNMRTGQVLRFGRDAVLETTARSDLHDFAAKYAARIATPLLVVTGGADTSVAPAEGRALADAAPQGRYLELDGADHVLGCRHPFSGTTPHFDRFVSEATAFFREHLA